jgi:hypothetical protein
LLILLIVIPTVASIAPGKTISPSSIPRRRAQQV